MKPLPVLEIRPQLQISADPFLRLLPPNKQEQSITHPTLLQCALPHQSHASRSHQHMMAIIHNPHRCEGRESYLQSLPVSIINSWLFFCADETLILVQKVLRQGTASSKAQRWCLYSAYPYCEVGVVLIICIIANNMTSRHQDHFTVYKDHCKKLNIAMHHHATRANTGSALNGYGFLFAISQIIC